MGDRHYTSAEKWILWIFLLVGGVGFTAYLKYYKAAFPEASVDLKISAADARRIAGDFIEKQGIQASGWKSVVIFQSNTNGKTYLERELGVEKANQLMASEVDIWHWYVRFFKPLQKEEARVWIGPQGKLVAYDHVVEEAKPGPKLTRPQAKRLAESFLSGTLQWDLERYHLVEDASTLRPKREDHSFVWERNGFKAKDATYRMRVGIQGGSVGTYSEYLKVPEEWNRSYAKLRAYNETLQRVAEFGVLIIQLCLGAFFIVQFRSRNVRWKPALALAILGAILMAAEAANDSPFRLVGYDTNQDFSAFVANGMSSALFKILSRAVFLFLSLAAGEAIYREQFPGKVSLSAMLSREGWKSKELHQACLIGIAAAMFGLGYQVLYYVGGQKIGFWTPLRIPYTDMLRSSIPWIYPLTGSFHAAFLEETIFRLFSIAFLRKYLKNDVAAVLLSAVVWGFLHSNYPQQPAYARGLELSVMGIFLGFLFIRFGIVATLIAHFTLDAFLMSFFLLRSPIPYYRGSGIAVTCLLLLPFSYASVHYLRRREFSDAESLLNGGDEPEMPEPEAYLPPAPPPPRKEAPAWALAVLAVLGLASLGYLAVSPRRGFGYFADAKAGRSEVKANADAYLRSLGEDPERYHSVLFFHNLKAKLAARYIYRAAGMEKLNDIYANELPYEAWTCRYFRPLEKKEFTVYLDPAGRALSYQMSLAEKGVGAALEQRQARGLAERYLRQEMRVPLDSYKLVDSSSTKRENRTDHYFEWETEQGKVLDGKFRISLEVLGDRVSSFSKYFKLPEAWVREEEKTTLKDALAKGLAIVLFIALFGFMVFSAAQEYSRGGLAQRKFAWKFALKAGAIVTAFGLLDILNGSLNFWAGYRTSTSLPAFVVRQVLGDLSRLLLTFFAATLLVAFAEERYRHFRATDQVPWRPTGIALKTALTVLFLLAINAGLEKFVGDFSQVHHWPREKFSAGMPEGLDVYVPFFEHLNMGVSMTLLFIPFAVILTFTLLTRLKKPVLLLLLASFFSILHNLNGAKSFSELAASSFGDLWSFGFLYLSLAYLLPPQPGAWILFMFMGITLDGAQGLMRQSNNFYRWNGIFVAFISLLPILMIAWRYLKARPRAEIA